MGCFNCGEPMERDDEDVTFFEYQPTPLSDGREWKKGEGTWFRAEIDGCKVCAIETAEANARRFLGDKYGGEDALTELANAYGYELVPKKAWAA
jgi:hypothetical protein